MSRTIPIASSFLLTTFLVGCGGTESYESTPVVVQSSQGTVTCQLYTDKYTLWDEAIAKPIELSSAAADAICKAEGERRMELARASK